jgi:polysaccharide deacetylase 2 family uncharacterized protein YibQ
MKKRKGSGSKKKIQPVLPLTLLFASLACIVLLGLYAGFSDRSGGNQSPLYEEIYSSDTDLNESIRKIDYTIYESLYKNGVPEKDVFFLNVQPRHRNGHVWEFSEILVNCPDNQFALNFQKIISHALSEFGADLTLRKERGPDGRIICHVYAKDFHTHKIILSVDGLKPSIQDARPRIAIIIDDLGYGSDTDFSFFQLELPLSFSVLPYGPFTQSIARKARKEGCELILHQPMEPKNYPSVKPGPGGLFLSMEANKIRQVLGQNLRLVEGARGMNNHMGSSFTEDREKMLIVLNELKKRHLFFVDSRTTKNTVALDLARGIGLPAARRRVFLDNNLAPKAMKIQMERLLSMSRQLGSAIGIGHPYKETYQLLEQYGPKIKKEFHVVPVSELVS